MCAPTPAGKAAFAALGQRFNLQVSGAGRGEFGRAAAAVYQRAKDGGRFQDTFIRARTTAAASEVPRLDEHQPTERVLRLGVLRGTGVRTVLCLRRG